MPVVRSVDNRIEPNIIKSWLLRLRISRLSVVLSAKYTSERVSCLWQVMYAIQEGENLFCGNRSTLSVSECHRDLDTTGQMVMELTKKSQ